MLKTKLFFLSFSTLLATQLLSFNTIALAKEYDPTTGYEIIRSGEWRSVKDRLPWSKPVLIQDKFSGEQTLAVFDKDYKDNFWQDAAEQGHFSLWRADGYIRVSSYQTCDEDWCGYRETRDVAIKVEIKVGNKIFEAEKSGIDFKLPSEIRPALALAAKQKEEIWIRAAFEHLGQSMTWRMGPNTINALSEIFAESRLSDEQSSFLNSEAKIIDPALIEPEAQDMFNLSQEPE